MDSSRSRDSAGPPSLRSALSRPGVLRIAGAWDGLSGLLAARTGFDGIWAGSLAISAAHGLPDAAILGTSEYIAAAGLMSEVSSLPVIADFDLGFSSACAIEHVIRGYERVRVAAICLEDKVGPKHNSFLEDHRLANVDEFSAIVKTIRDVRENLDFLVFARTEALIAGRGVEFALERGEAYAAAGADVVLIHSKSDTATQVLQFAEEWRRRGHTQPLAAIPTTFFKASAQELFAGGIKIVIYANQSLRAAVHAIRGTLEAILQADSSAHLEAELSSVQEVLSLVGTDRCKATETRFQDLLGILKRPDEIPGA